MALAAAPHIPGFRALSPTGYGPTSTIFSAQSTSLARWVALTVYSTTLADDRSQRRFMRAFETARRLGSHPHAVTLLEAGLTPERQPYVASEIYERGTLDARLGGRQPLLVGEVLHFGVALAGVLETAHRAGVVHGGLHPGRVLLSNAGEPALADLNLVPLVEGGLAALVGPRHHVPPEVLEGEELTPATDVFSLASTLYTALTGRPPYQGDNPEADTAASLLLRMLQRTVPPIGRRDVPPSLETRLAQALDSIAANRPATPLAFAALLQGIQQELSLPGSEPVVLDIAPAPTLSVADEHMSNGTGRAHTNGNAASNGHVSTNGNASDNGTTPVQRVFVPYVPPESQPEPEPTASPEPPAALPPSAALAAAPLADVPDFPAPPQPEPVPEPAAEPPPRPSIFSTSAYHQPQPAEPSEQSGSSDGWPWFVEDNVETFDPQPGSVAVLDGPPVDRGAAAEPASQPKTEADAEATAAADAASTAAGDQRARALPVMILMSLVAVLVVGVGWMIVTGENPSQAGTTTTQSSATSNEDGTVSPDTVTAAEVGADVQIDWDGSSDVPQVVLVLSTTEAPRTLPAETGSVLLIDATQLTDGTGYCFAVAPATPQGTDAATGAASAAAIVDELPDDALGPNACIRGATADAVRRA